MHLALLSLIAPFLAQLSTAYPSPAITPTPDAAVAHNPSCYTYTTSLHPQTCEPLACAELMCITMSTTKVPCPTASCASTPTVTEWLPCRTACRGGCATSTVQVVPDDCREG